MFSRLAFRPTILQVMVLVAVIGCLSGLLIRNGDQFDLIKRLTLGLLIIAGPSLLAIEANRREAAPLAKLTTRLSRGN